MRIDLAKLQRKPEPVWTTHTEQCPCCGHDTLEVSTADGVNPYSGEPLYRERCSRSQCGSNHGRQTLSMFV